MPPPWKKAPMVSPIVPVSSVRLTWAWPIILATCKLLKLMKQSIYFLSLLTFLLACSDKKKEAADFSAVAPVLVDSLPGSCPYLTQDKQGHAVVSGVRNTSDSTAVSAYAFPTDVGNHFGKPIIIP